jgi:hypothetical protein
MSAKSIMQLRNEQMATALARQQQPGTPPGTPPDMPYPAPRAPLNPPEKRMRLMSRDEKQEVLNGVHAHAAGGFLFEFCQAFEIKASAELTRGAIHASSAKLAEDLTRVAGVYWLVYFHEGKPIYRKAKGDCELSDSNLFLWYFDSPAEEGWYVSSMLWSDVKRSKEYQRNGHIPLCWLDARAPDAITSDTKIHYPFNSKNALEGLSIDAYLVPPYCAQAPDAVPALGCNEGGDDDHDESDDAGAKGNKDKGKGKGKGKGRMPKRGGWGPKAVTMAAMAEADLDPTPLVQGLKAKSRWFAGAILNERARFVEDPQNAARAIEMHLRN